MTVLIAPPAPAASCENLASLKLANTTITLASAVAAGAFIPLAPSGPATAATQFSILPPCCSVAATLAPSSDSDIKKEGWFQAARNGGFGGVIGYPALAAALKAGYASASTDTGHPNCGIPGWSVTGYLEWTRSGRESIFPRQRYHSIGV